MVSNLFIVWYAKNFPKVYPADPEKEVMLLFIFVSALIRFKGMAERLSAILFAPKIPATHETTVNVHVGQAYLTLFLLVEVEKVGCHLA